MMTIFFCDELLLIVAVLPHGAHLSLCVGNSQVRRREWRSAIPMSIMLGRRAIGSSPVLASIGAVLVSFRISVGLSMVGPMFSIDGGDRGLGQKHDWSFISKTATSTCLPAESCGWLVSWTFRAGEFLARVKQVTSAFVEA